MANSLLFSSFIKNASFAKRVAITFIPAALGILLLAGLNRLAARAQAGLQTLTYGQGVWSIKVEDAVQGLLMYDATRETVYLDLFQAALKGPLEAGACRVEARKSEPDKGRALAGYLALGLPQSEFRDMFWLLRAGGRLEPFAPTFAVWERGEQKLAELNLLAEEISLEKPHQHGRERGAACATVSRIFKLDLEQEKLAAEFSPGLMAQRQWLRRTAAYARLAIVALLLAPALLLFSLFTLDYSCKGRCLMAYLDRIKKGEPPGGCGIESADEAGRLAAALEQLLSDLGRSALASEKAIREAQAANAAKSDFVGNISHELYTPLNSILGFSEVLADGGAGPVNEKQGKYLRNIYTSGRDLRELVDSLMDIVKLETGEAAFAAEELLAEEMAVYFRDALLKKAGAKKLEFKADTGGTWAFNCDGRKLRRILEILAANAAKFTPEGGRISFTILLKGRAVEILVADTGIGIAAGDLPRLFQPFARAERTLTKAYAGLGTGLYLAKKLAELLGGTITASSPGPGLGSTFSLTLPVDTETGRSNSGYEQPETSV